MSSAPDAQHHPPKGRGFEDRNAHRRSGWAAGILGGVLVVLIAFPPSRYTLLSQLQFTLAERSLPYLHALMVRPSNREMALLDRVTTSSPDDYLMQVGRATVLAAQGGLHPRLNTGSGKGGDNTLFRLGAVVEHFPSVPGAYAHLTRYMMKDRIRLERPEVEGSTGGTTRTTELSGPGLGPRPIGPVGLHSERTPVSADDIVSPSTSPNPDDVRMMEWALRAGERRDPDNAFWPAMLATTYFSIKRDSDGVEALRRASLKIRWDAYIYEEVLGEWRLYSAAYGDNGAIQKIGPLSLVSFPHLGEIRKMAQFVRYLAEVAERSGNDAVAINLRRELMIVGTVMRSRAQWAYEALIGTDVCLIAATDSDAKIMPGRIRTVAVWQAQAPKYIALLKRNGRIVDIVWLRREIDNCCQLRNRIDLARYDASYPGIPPGIPLTPLFGSWMACVCLIQEILTLLAVVALIRMLESLRRRSQINPSARRARQAMIVILGGAWLASAVMAISGGPSTRFMVLFLLLSAVNTMLAVDAVKTARIRIVARSRTATVPFEADPKAAELSESGFPDSRREWQPHSIALLAALVACPTLVGIGLYWPMLSAQHPVAAALTSLVDLAHNVTTGEALQAALFGIMVSLTAMIVLTIAALFRKRTVLQQVNKDITRLAAPTIVLLALAYVVMLNRTIYLDLDASRAISDAARNDLQWVLTHSGEAPQ